MARQRTLNSERKKILDMVLEHPGLSCVEIVKRLDMPMNDWRSATKILFKSGALVSMGKRGRCKYFIKGTAPANLIEEKRKNTGLPYREKSQIMALANFLKATIQKRPGLNCSEIFAIAVPAMEAKKIPCEKRMVQNAIAGFRHSGFLRCTGIVHEYRYFWADGSDHKIDENIELLPIRQIWKSQDEWTSRGSFIRAAMDDVPKKDFQEQINGYP